MLGFTLARLPAYACPCMPVRCRFPFKWPADGQMRAIEDAIIDRAWAAQAPWGRPCGPRWDGRVTSDLLFGRLLAFDLANTDSRVELSVTGSRAIFLASSEFLDMDLGALFDP